MTSNHKLTPRGMVCMIITYMKCAYRHITSLGFLPKILHVKLYVLDKMNTVEVTFGTLDTGIIPPH